MAVSYVLRVLWLTILCGVLVVARPSCSSEGTYSQENCIPMTPQREAEIQDIVSEISEYADDLAEKHEFFDIRLMKFAIERHSPNEPEDKNVEIQVTINDCAGEGSNLKDSNQNPDQTNTDLAVQNTEVEKQSSSPPQLIHLDLDETGQQFLQRIEEIRGHKNPLLVLLLGDDYVFF